MKIKKIKISTYEKLNYLLINLSYQQYYLLYENKKISTSMKIFRNAIKGQVDCKRWLAMLTER